MFFRIKTVGSHQYLQIVHSVREGKKVRQRVLGTLGRFDELKASGRLDALMRSGLRHCEKFAVIDAHKAGETEIGRRATHGKPAGEVSASRNLGQSRTFGDQPPTIKVETIRVATLVHQKYQN